MTTVKINGTDYPVRATFGHWRKLAKKYGDLTKITSWPEDRYKEFVLDATWMTLRRKRGLKPGIFRFRLPSLLTMTEFNTLQVNIHKILIGEEDESLGK